MRETLAFVFILGRSYGPGLGCWASAFFMENGSIFGGGSLIRPGLVNIRGGYFLTSW
jgi:hypothetical protein